MLINPVSAVTICYNIYDRQDARVARVLFYVARVARILWGLKLSPEQYPL
jgi:hypothetical protein